MVKKTAEERIKVLLKKHTYPPLEVIIPILQKAGRGEQELSAQLYATEVGVIKGMREILGLKENDLKTLAKIFGVMMAHYGQKFEPIELSESRFSVGIRDCPMMHVGKDVGVNVKSKFCDLVCSNGLSALKDSFGQDNIVCSWDKALIKGGGKCKLVFELVKSK